ncbi:MAG: DUF427 domain-containing protein [Candidatus Nanopelagicales bacterium]
MPLPRGVVPETPGPGQESVWDYPRPPVLRSSSALVVIELGGVEVCRSTRGVQYLETSHPPSWYLPPEDWAPGALAPGEGSSVCEWKGVASYLDVRGGDRVERSAAWSYPAPTRAFAAIAGFVAVYPARMDRVTVDGEVVRAQEGGFYGGWVTDAVVGPFKGVPGSWGW